MEIRLDDVDTEAYVEGMRTNAWDLTLAGTSTEISGQSEALEKFLSSYETFVKELKEYQSVLAGDIQSISKIVNTWVEKDKAQSEQIEGLGGLFHFPGNP